MVFIIIVERISKSIVLCEESMESLVVLVHTIGIHFRCGGKLDLTSEGGHLGFSKMVAVKLLFSKCQRLIGLDFLFQCLNLYFQGQGIQWDVIQEPKAHMQAVFYYFL